ncbi:MAG: hypothetical protein OXN92_15015 [Gammaproteobacteria bacterium]|nr:hypothetical protein [Gammaproteobacteria bacterium]
MTTRTRLVVVAVLATALTAVVFAERASEERANRLHRRGDWSSAARIYRARLQEEVPVAPGAVATESPAAPEDAARDTGPTPALEPRAPYLHYNLGTTLLELAEAPDARARLSRGAAGPDDELRSLAWYNLGVASLRAAIAAPGSDSALVHVVAAMEENRNALRLSPGREEAAWNLAFARRMLDSLDTGARRGVQAGEAFSDAELTGDDNRAEGESGDIMAPPGMLGEEETVVDPEAEQPLSLAEAAAILNGIRLDGELITRKLLGLASRSLWGTRSRTLGRRW